MDFVTKGNEYSYDQILSGNGHKTMELVYHKVKLSKEDML